MAAALRNRSTEVVKAFYSVCESGVNIGLDFQSYSSLPDGVISVIGLLAMMTDHYGVLSYSSLPDGVASVSGLLAMITDHYGVLPSFWFLKRGCFSSLIS
ncbi:hypothetical protein V6N13_010940 [Hibiscus sabdariffa]